jgi:hypothetical protein
METTALTSSVATRKSRLGSRGRATSTSRP